MAVVVVVVVVQVRRKQRLHMLLEAGSPGAQAVA